MTPFGEFRGEISLCGNTDNSNTSEKWQGAGQEGLAETVKKPFILQWFYLFVCVFVCWFVCFIFTTEEEEEEEDEEEVITHDPPRAVK